MKNSTKIAVNELVRLLGGTTWTRTASKCTGKWSGTTDYGILIDGRIKLFVSNGMAGFETRVREWIASFKTFQVKKDYYLELLREQARRDNATAISEGLYPVHVLDIGIVSPEASEGFYYFYPYVLIEVNGLRYKHLTSNLGCAIFRDFLAEWIKARNAKATTTAGGIDNPDFIFCNVRFDSRNGMYRIQ